MRNKILSIFIAGIWISFSEFFRNELLLKDYWIGHYSSLGLKFQTLPLNGILWLIWSFILAYLIFIFLQKFSFKKTLIISWLSFFLMMWITIFNLQVLPIKILLLAIPLSFFEIFVAEKIIVKILKLKI